MLRTQQAAVASRQQGASQLGRIMIILSIALLVVGFLIRIGEAFYTTDIINHDETYYTSIILTALRGEGIYPKIMGFAPMRLMGGIGAMVFINIGLADWFGYNILLLRAVSAVMGFVAIGGIYAASRQLFDPVTALVTAAVASTSTLFIVAASIRMDSYIMAFVAWALFFVLWFHKPRWQARWHLIPGIVISLGMQAHLDATVAAGSFGFLYLYWIWERWRNERVFWPQVWPLLWYVAGFGVGLVVFVAFNILPDPDSFFAPLVSVKAMAVQNQNILYATQSSSPELNAEIVAASPSIIDLESLWASLAAFVFSARQYANPVDWVLVLLVSPLLILSKAPVMRSIRILFLGVVVFGILIFKDANLVYISHMLPILVLPVGVYFTHLLRPTVSIRNINVILLEVYLLCVIAFFFPTILRSLDIFGGKIAPPPLNSQAALVTEIAQPTDVIAGMPDDYVPYYTAFPEYISHMPTLVARAMRQRGMTDSDVYLDTMDIDIFVGPFSPLIADYITRRDYVDIGEGVWARPEVAARGTP